MSEAQFINGLIVKAPHPNAPDFVKFGLSIKREELIATLQAMQGEWVNAQVKESRGGKLYAQVDDWKPEQNRAPQQQAQPQQGQPENFESDIPF